MLFLEKHSQMSISRLGGTLPSIYGKEHNGTNEGLLNTPRKFTVQFSGHLAKLQKQNVLCDSLTFLMGSELLSLFDRAVAWTSALLYHVITYFHVLPNLFRDELLYLRSKVATPESLMIVMGYSVRHCSSREAMEDLLNLVDAHLLDETQYLSSKYVFLKHFSGSQNSKMKHFYRSNCR